jgi:hypothetical protein
VITIRSEQAAVFAERAIDRFVGDLVAHFRQHLPQHVAALGEDDVREAIHYGIGRARSYRIESEAAVRVFIQVMFVVGPDFDADPRLPWASRCLLADAHEEERVGALLAAAREHLEGLSGARKGGV